MKFAKELEEDLVPEWRAKYLNYKEGKKRVKAVAKVVRSTNTTPRFGAKSNPRSGDLSSPSAQRTSPFFGTSRNSPLKRGAIGTDGTQEDAGPREPLRSSPAAFAADDSRPASDESSDNNQASIPILIPSRQRGVNSDASATMQYGSIVATPPKLPAGPLQLPDPAVQPSTSPDLLARRGFGRHRSSSMSAGNRPRALMQRVFSTAAPLSRQQSRKLDINMRDLDQVRSTQKEFFEWMDKQLDKIESFYQEKEDQAGQRLQVLREQLHIMRNRRIDEISAAAEAREARQQHEDGGMDIFGRRSHEGADGRPNHRDVKWSAPIERIIDKAKAKAVGPHPGPNSKALSNMQSSPGLLPRANDPGRDYERRHQEHEVPYRLAKRKLKLALKEFYRGLELLKSYALLNRTGFRKINKKYDKAVNAHPPLRYMSEKVNKAHFVKSEILDQHLHAVEDLYARYFERGNHKIAIGKLRSSNKHHGEYTFTAFRSGLMLGLGAVFACQGLSFCLDIQREYPDPVIQVQVQYLLQIYAGYFLAIFLFSLFCIDCSIWTANKINYPFIFEFDPRHHLDWRQLAEFPTFLFALLGLFMWINFSRYGAAAMFIYYPVILVGLTVILIFLPAPTLFHRSRRWFVYSNWRLLMAGLYPVEFRDFFLGDMFCSLTYFTSNISLFFCLYAHFWNDESQCNSTHSRLMGFFASLPGIWRLLQCLRRYNDSGDKWPHLANGLKYTLTIVSQMTLSIYRIDQTWTNLSIFITFASLNGFYCSFWDLVMDWSLGQPGAKKPFLRNTRAFKQTWPYYSSMVLDPILRFNWVFYAIYTHNVQHSSTASFFVAFSEITRRGMWTIFRVENEHCSNVSRFKASRDVPLPYSLESSDVEETVETEHGLGTESNGITSSVEQTANNASPSPALSRMRSRASGADAEEGRAGGSNEEQSSRFRGAARTITALLANAHTKDFEKKRKSGAGDSDNPANRARDGEPVTDASDDGQEVVSSDDEDEDDQSVLDAITARVLSDQS